MITSDDVNQNWVWWNSVHCYRLGVYCCVDEIFASVDVHNHNNTHNQVVGCLYVAC